MRMMKAGAMRRARKGEAGSLSFAYDAVASDDNMKFIAELLGDQGITERKQTKFFQPSECRVCPGFSHEQTTV